MKLCGCSTMDFWLQVPENEWNIHDFCNNIFLSLVERPFIATNVYFSIICKHKHACNTNMIQLTENMWCRHLSINMMVVIH
jgi:hypothetical protein